MNRSRRPPAAPAAITPLRPLAALALGGLLAGCQHLPAGLMGDLQRSVDNEDAAVKAPVTLPPAARPRYQSGDTFIYGRSSVRRVVALAPDAVLWQGSAADPAGEPLRYRTSTELFAPVLDFPGREDAAVSRITDREGSLWPLQAGRSTRFTEWRRLPGLPGSEQRYQWQCRVGEPRVVSVPAGDFPSYPVRCQAGLASLAGLPLAAQQRLTWDYAPSLGHYVRRSWTENGRLRETVLSAALPAALATPERVARTVQRLQAAP